MSYHSGTILSAAPSTDLMAAIDTHIQAHPAWERVEQVVNGAVIANVYRCLGSVNGLGVDFYVVFRSSTPISTVETFLGEQYDSGTKILSKVPLRIRSSANQATPSADGTTTATYNVSTGAIASLPASYNIGVFQNQVSTSGFSWYMSVQNDCLMLRTSSAVSGGFVGTYTNVHDLAVQPAPHLCIGSFENQADTMQGFCVTRDVPNVASSYCWTSGTYREMLSTAAFVPNKDPLSNKWYSHPIVLTHPRGSTSTSSSIPILGVRGYIPSSKLKWLGMSEFTEAVGDTVTIDGVIHTCFYVNIWVPQAA